jgi:thiol:disulfide interchange protein DsbD
MGRFVCLFVLLAFGAAGNAQGPAQHVRVSLVSGTGLQPGSTQELGVHFQLDPGWHIYWINPGDSGEPPRIAWHLPPGFEVVQVEFPTPKRLESHSLTDYGYQDDVVLLANLSVPKTFEAKSADLAADIRWLVCREVCIPGRGSVSVRLAARQSEGTDSNLIREAKQKLPQPAPSTWKLSARQQGPDVLLSMRAGRSVAVSDFIPAEPLQIDNARRPIVHELPTGAQLTLKKSDQLTQPLRELRGILIAGDKAYWVTFPMSPSSNRQSKNRLRGSARP